MRASVDPDRCAGHGICVSTCPAVFSLTDDGFAEVRVDPIPVEYTGLVEQAVSECPEQAISVVGD